ncbi:MAG: UDP-N-acetylmuramoyl-tripeptide--D-alanyl-D-alanine ligase [Opitutales bacterium]|nr:UDP-N-acetylmuramoyl-tripeptide--D-alanyl-D-alanine ligase [Opitutales bacterium]
MALTSERDGHDFLSAAKAAGASCALVSRHCPEIDFPQLLVSDTLKGLQQIAKAYRKLFRGKLIAITGSCGKTSTKDLLAGLLGDSHVHKTQGNLNNHIGVPLSILSLDLQQHHFSVLEAGINHPGEMQVLADIICPDSAVVTNVASAHLEGLGSEETVAGEKAKLLEAVAGSGRCYFHADCLRYKPFERLALRSTVITQQTGKHAPDSFYETIEYRNESLRVSSNTGRRIALRRPVGPFSYFHIRSLSEGMLMNVALAVAIAQDCGVSDSDIQLRLLRWIPGNLRGTVISEGSTRYYVDCYNANPVSMADTIEYFASEFSETPCVYVLAGMRELGVHSAELHRQVGHKMRLRPEDRVYLLGNDAEAFAQGIIEAGNSSGAVHLCESLEQLREALVPLKSKPLSILLKGSRSYALEQLLPSTSLSSTVQHAC